MPKVKITGLPKFASGGQCPYGEVFDPVLQQCVPDINYAGTSSTTQTTTVAPDVRDPLTGCIVGKEVWSVEDQKCIPADQQYAQKFNVNPTLSTGTPKTGPGTGVNPNAPTSNNNQVDWKTQVQKANASLMGALNMGSGIARLAKNKRIAKETERAIREANFSGPVQPGRNLGNVETNTGVQFPNMLSPVNEGMFITQFGGNLMGQSNQNKVKIRIEAAPEQMKFGGQSGYGLDLGWRKFYTDMSKTTADHYTNSMSEEKDPDEPPVIEAEGGETFIRPEADGTASFFEVRGDRHTDGGVELTQEQVGSRIPKMPSFMFSDTPKLKIKNPEILKMFDVPESQWKKGVTPAKISKKFSLNQWNAIIKDPNKDNLAKDTAQMMIAKNTEMLAKLAAVQESMKGEQVPVFAQQRLMQGKAKYGGKVGGLPKYTNGGPPDWTKDFEQVKTLLTSPEFADLRKALYSRYKQGRGKNDAISEDEYIKSLLEGQRQKYVINEKLATDPRLKSKNWDLGVRSGFGKNVFYKQIAKELGLDPQSEKDILRSQQAFLDMYDLLSSEPEFIKKYGNVFALERLGVADEPEYKGQKNITKADEWRGNTDIGQLIRLAKTPQKPPDTIIPPPSKKIPPPPGTVKRYVCAPDPNNKGRFIAKEVEVSEGAGGFATAAEAEAFCNRGSKEIPFGYTAPDAYNMFASSAVFPRLIMPFVPTPQMETPPLALEDWRARTANRFATMYAAPAQTLATYGPAQGLGANLSKLSGEAAQAQAAQDMAPIIGSNINRANQWYSQNAGIRNAQRQLEAQAQKERWMGRATALQQYDNAIRGYLKDFGKAFDRGWNNRQKLGDINDTNVHFYKNPWTGRQVFKGNTAGFAGLGAGYSTGANAASLGSAYAALYAKYLKELEGVTMPEKSDKTKEEIASELAMMDIRGSKRTQRTDKYGNPLGGTSTEFDLDDDAYPQ